MNELVHTLTSTTVYLCKQGGWTLIFFPGHVYGVKGSRNVVFFPPA